jgi:ectoine hydroxylase-related dioxygenase (phytanoyl-CoA dioxygenase family)
VTVNTIWVLDPMDAENDASRLIPGTHHTAELADDSDSRVTYVEAAPGSVVVTNAHVLQGASMNRDGRRRRVIHGYFTRRGRPAQTDFRYYASPASLGRLPASWRALFDID